MAVSTQSFVSARYYIKSSCFPRLVKYRTQTVFPLWFLLKKKKEMVFEFIISSRKQRTALIYAKQDLILMAIRHSVAFTGCNPYQGRPHDWSQRKNSPAATDHCYSKCFNPRKAAKQRGNLACSARGGPNTTSGPTAGSVGAPGALTGCPRKEKRRQQPNSWLTSGFAAPPEQLRDPHGQAPSCHHHHHEHRPGRGPQSRGAGRASPPLSQHRPRRRLPGSPPRRGTARSGRSPPGWPRLPGLHLPPWGRRLPAAPLRPGWACAEPPGGRKMAAARAPLVRAALAVPPCRPWRFFISCFSEGIRASSPLGGGIGVPPVFGGVRSPGLSLVTCRNLPFLPLSVCLQRVSQCVSVTPGKQKRLDRVEERRWCFFGDHFPFLPLGCYFCFQQHGDGPPHSTLGHCRKITFKPVHLCFCLPRGEVSLFYYHCWCLALTGLNLLASSVSDGKVLSCHAACKLAGDCDTARGDGHPSFFLVCP